MRKLSYIAFFSIGTIQGLVGAVIPPAMSELGIAYAMAGMIMTGEALGNLCTNVFMVAAGEGIARRRGMKILLAVGGALMSAGLLIPAPAPSFPLLLAGIVVAGIGATLFDVGFNAIVMDGPDEGKGHALGLLHFFFGAGAFAGPFLAPLCASLPGTFRTALALAAGLPLLLTVWILRAPFPVPAADAADAANAADGADAGEGAAGGADGKAARGEKLALSPWLWTAGAALFLYALWEINMGTWIAAWAEGPGAGTGDGSLFGAALSRLPSAAWTSLFWLSLTVGRLFAGRISDATGFGPFIAGACATAAAAALAWAAFPSPAVGFVATIVLGLAAAGVFPGFMALAAERFPGRSSGTASFLFLFSAAGGMAVGPLVGGLADAAGGIGVLPLTVAGAALAMLVALAVLRRGRGARRR